MPEEPDPISAEELQRQRDAALLELEESRRVQLALEAPHYQAVFQVIGRAEATVLRQHNKYNRKVSKAHSHKLAKFMEEDRWTINGCPIVLNGAGETGVGEVLDGAHRLDAVIESGVPQLMLVVKGVKSAAFETFDIYNKKRSSADMFFITGEEAPSVLADSLNWLNARLRTNTWASKPLLHFARVQLLAEHPEIREYVKKYAGSKGGPRIPKGLLAAAEYLFTVAAGPEAASGFMDRIFYGAGLTEGDQTLVFRQWFDGLPEKRTKKDYVRIGAGLVFAWNAMRQVETILKIKAPAGPVEIL